MTYPGGSSPSGYSNNTETNFPNNEYGITDSGPYFIFIEKKIIVKYYTNEEGKDIIYDEDTGLGNVVISETKTKMINQPLHPMVFGKFIFQTMNKYNHAILGISQINRFKIRIQFQTSSDANAFVKDPILRDSCYVGYIPLFFTTKVGVVRNYPQELDVIDFLESQFCRSPCKILKAERMNRFSTLTGGSPTLTPTNSVKITFGSQKLPSYIDVHSVRCEVLPYIPRPQVCKKCWRFNHNIRNCRSNLPRCKACGQLDSHELDSCPMKDDPVCLNCKKDHFCSELNKCEEYIKQRKIKELMVLKNYSYKEALDTIMYKPFSDAISYVPLKPFTYDMEEFPTIKAKHNTNTTNNKRPIQLNDNNETNERKHQKFRYNKIQKIRHQPNPVPNFILPKENINTCTSPLHPNPKGPRQQDESEDMILNDICEDPPISVQGIQSNKFNVMTFHRNNNNSPENQNINNLE